MHLAGGYLYQGGIPRLGIGSQFIDYITKKYPDALLRLEVEEENARAVHVYKKSGFEFFEYKEMKKSKGNGNFRFYGE